MKVESRVPVVVGCGIPYAGVGSVHLSVALLGVRWSAKWWGPGRTGQDGGIKFNGFFISPASLWWGKLGLGRGAGPPVVRAIDVGRGQGLGDEL